MQQIQRADLKNYPNLAYECSKESIISYKNIMILYYLTSLREFLKKCLNNLMIVKILLLSYPCNAEIDVETLAKKYKNIFLEVLLI